MFLTFKQVRSSEYLEQIIGTEDINEKKVVKDGTIRDIDTLFDHYARLASEVPDPVVLTDSSLSSICLLEKAMEKRCSIIFIGSRGSGRRQTVAFSSHLVGFAQENVNPKITEKEWNDLLEKALHACILDGAKIVISLPEMITDPTMRARILSDISPLVMRSALPSRMLSHQLLCQVSDKYSIGGPGLWPEMRKKLCDSLIFIFTFTQDDAYRFLDEYDEISSNCVMIWASSVDMISLRQSARTLIERSKLFPDSKVDCMLDALCRIQDIFFEEKLIGMDAKFVEFVKTFLVLCKEKRDRVDVVMKRYEKGMDKLRKAEEQMGFLQGELLVLRPELLNTSMETSILMSNIERESIEVENQREVVAANEYKANEAATKAQALKVESEEDLANALPSLEAAVDALETMKQSDISSLKTMRYPPYGVRMCMEAVCILFGEAPTRIPNPMGEATFDYWPTGQRLLSDIHFLSRIKNFPRDSVPKKTIGLIREKYLSKEDFDPEKVKQCSLAAEGLCLWVKAVDLYSRIAGIVQPKKEKLRKAELLVKQHMKQLEVKRKALTKVTEKLQYLSDQYSQMSQKKQELQSKIHVCETRMERAERLVYALGGEKQKWSTKMDSVRREMEEVPWLSLAHSAAMEFLTLQPLPVRESVMSRVGVGLLPPSRSSLFLDGLDDISVLKNATKTAFLIDFQNETKELCDKALCGGCYDVVEMELGYEAVWEAIRSAAEQGRPILIRNIAYSLPSHIEFLHVRPIMNESGQVIVINEVECPAKTGFRLIFSGEGPVEPNVIPRLAEMGAVFHLAMSVSSIEQRTKATILSRNCAQIVERRNELQLRIDECTKQLAGLEESMLDLLARSQELDDEKAIELLQQSKQLQETNEAAKSDLKAVMKKLSRLEDVLTPVFKWAAEAVSIVRSLSSFSPWYNFSPSYLISILDVPLFDPVEGAESEALPVGEMRHKISHLLWSEISPSLRCDHRHIFHLALQTQIKDNPPKVTSLSSFHSPPAVDVDLSRAILQRSSCRQPLILILPPSSAGFPDLIPDFYKGKVLHTIVDRHLPDLLLANISEPVWIVASGSSINNHLNSMVKFMEEMSSVESVNPSFRLFIVVAQMQPLRRWIDHSRVLFIDRPDSLRSFIRSVALTPAFATTIASITIAQESQLISLIALHFALRIRSSYGLHGFTGEYHFTEYHLISMLKLFKEAIMGSKETATVSRLRICVVHPAYSSFMSNENDKLIIDTMFDWIFKGLNKQDDTVLGTFLSREPTNRHDIYKDFHSDGHELCGLSPLLISQVRKARERKTLADYSLIARGHDPVSHPCSGRSTAVENVVTMEQEENLTGRSLQSVSTFRSGYSSTGRQLFFTQTAYPQGRGVVDCATVRTGKPCLLNYLLNELESCKNDQDRHHYIKSLVLRVDSSTEPLPSINIDSTMLIHPYALLATLIAIVAEKTKTSLAEIDLEGEVFTSSTNLPKPSNPSLHILLSVYLINARLDAAGLRDADTEPQRVTIRVAAHPRRPPKEKTQAAVAAAKPAHKERSISGLPLIQPGIAKPLMYIPVKTTIPMNHWVLRGVRLMTVHPSIMSTVRDVVFEKD